MKPYYYVVGTTRASAIAAFRAIPLPERRKLIADRAGIAYLDTHRIEHTMAWSVVEEEGGLKRALAERPA